MDKPTHYDVPIDVISFARLVLTDEEYIGAMKFSALKYFFRQGRKEGTNDSKKCLDYLEHLNTINYGLYDKNSLLEDLDESINGGAENGF